MPHKTADRIFMQPGLVPLSLSKSAAYEKECAKSTGGEERDGNAQPLIKKHLTWKTGRKWPRVLKCDPIQNAPPGCHFKVESM